MDGEVYNTGKKGSMGIREKICALRFKILGNNTRRFQVSYGALALALASCKTAKANREFWRNTMRFLMCLLFLAMAVTAAEKSVHDFTLNSIDGQPVPLLAYKGKVILIVNVASKCGFTPQYTALESIYEKYKDRGFVIVGVPANNFGAQEPGTNQEIKTFCSSKYHVTFPMVAKVSVKGEDITPLYQFLTDKATHPQTGGEIQWNFTKFLVGPDGHVISRFEPQVTPDSPEVVGAIERALATIRP